MRSNSMNALYAVLSTEGRLVGPCWEKLRPKGHKGGPDEIVGRLRTSRYQAMKEREFFVDNLQTSLIRTPPPVGPYRRPCRRVLGVS